MRSLIMATYITAFTSLARATSKATKATLFLFPLAVLLAGGAATVRGHSVDGFDPNTNGTVYAGILLGTSTADSGSGSLRQALAEATNGDTIQFDGALNGQAITLTSAELVIDKNIAISGPGTPTPTPTGAKMAFASNPQTFESNNEIFVMDLNGANQTQLTFHGSTLSDSSRPSWSRDGTKIAFQRSYFIPPNFPPNSYIYTMNADGSAQTGLTSGATLDSSPAWSPDGTRIAFVSNRDGNAEIYVMDANGSNQTNLTNSPASGEDSPAWSPDGTKIVFTSSRDGNFEIYVMDANGSNQLRLTNNPASDTSPGWSPDGTKIAFTSQRDGNNEIYVMNANGSNQTNLTNNPGSSDSDPSWSSDGARIAFATTRNGNGEIYVMDADGSNQTNLTNSTRPDKDPDWQRSPGSLTPTPTPTPTPTSTPTPTPTPTPTTCPLFREHFDNITTLVPGGWFMQNNSQPGPGTTGWFQGNGAVFPGLSGSYIGTNFNNGTGTSTLSNWLLTPPLTVQNGVVLSFWTRTVDTPSFPDRLQVRLSTNGASTDVGTLATDVGDFTTLLLDINPAYTPTGYPNGWTPFTVTLSGLGSPTTGRLALRYFVQNGGPSGANSDYIGIDALQIAGPCNPQPTPIPGPTPAPGPELMIFNSWGAFGSEMVGSSSNPIQFTVFHNLGGTATGLSISLSGPDATHFSITSNSCGSTLGDHQSCFVTMRFNPFTAGPKSATLSAQANCAQCTAVATLTGTGRPLSATPAPTPAPTPPPTVSISGTVLYCSNPALNPVPGVTITLTGTMAGVTTTDGSGNYTFSSLPSGGNYVVTPSIANRIPGSANINGTDVLGVRRHFLSIALLPVGCRRTAADVDGVFPPGGNGTINGVDVVAIQRFFLANTSGTANVGKYKFAPANRTYTAVTSNQTAQSYDALIFGDVNSAFVNRPDGQ